MAQFNHMQTYGGNASPTMEQLFREGDASRWSPTHSSHGLGKDHDLEDDIDFHQKKSVFAKVKEKAKKLRYTLSNKKIRQGEHDNTTPSWGYNLDENEDEDGIDAEYLGAPMYESELAPEDCKENARQHPRADPVIADNHILANTIKLASGRDEKPFDSSATSSQKATESSIGNINTTTKTVAACSTTKKVQEKEVVKPSSPSKTLTETVTEKLAPVYSSVTDATHALASKIQSLAVSAPSNATTRSSHATQQKASSPTAPQIWDKGVSVKEYLMNKFEPDEDERALSQVLSDALSPTKEPGDVGVVEKMREAVNSMLWADEAPKPNATHLAAKSSSQEPVVAHMVAKSSSRVESLQKPVAAKFASRVESSSKPVAAKSSLRAEEKSQPVAAHVAAKPLSQAKAAPQATLTANLAAKSTSTAPHFTTTHIVTEEENLERILQAN